MSTRHTRRTFLATAAAVSLAGPLSRVRGANDDIRVAVLGLGNKGKQHVDMFHSLEGVRVVTLCDPDRAVLDDVAQSFGDPVKTETDPRAVFDDREVDAVVVAAPNHWHGLATVWACQAGKDVYVEKPASYDLWEGRQMIAAARKYDRIVQTGTQRRSDEQLMHALREIRDGKLGKIQHVHLLHYQIRGSTGRTVIEPPASVDYDVYQGPAPLSEIRRANFHYDWHWFWETGNGEYGNNGPHGIDLARFVLDQDTLPRRVWSVGGRFNVDDYAETPNTQFVYLDYQPAPIIVEVKNLPMQAGASASPAYRDLRFGIVVIGEDGYFTGMNGGTFYDHDGRRVETVDSDGGRHHQANFIKAVRSRNHRDLTCDIREGHLSGGLCHLGNISYRLGELASPDHALELTRSDAATRDSFERMLDHIHRNEVDLQGDQPLRVGPSLDFDPEEETFTGPDSDLVQQANALLRRTYREPWVLPEEV